MPKRAPTHKPTDARIRMRMTPVHLASEDVRLSRHERGYTNRWARYSKQRLLEHPWCVDCDDEGFAALGRVTDHIVPPQGPNDPLFWAPTNHQTLCERHHNIKTATHDGGFGNRKRARGSNA